MVAGRRAREQAHQPARAKMTRNASTAPNTSRQYGNADITMSWRKMKAKAPSTGPKKCPKPPSSDHEDDVPGVGPVGEGGVHVPGGQDQSTPPIAAYTAEITKATTGSA